MLKFRNLEPQTTPKLAIVKNFDGCIVGLWLEFTLRSAPPIAMQTLTLTLKDNIRNVFRIREKTEKNIIEYSTLICTIIRLKKDTNRPTPSWATHWEATNRLGLVGTRKITKNANFYRIE